MHAACSTRHAAYTPDLPESRLCHHVKRDRLFHVKCPGRVGCGADRQCLDDDAISFLRTDDGISSGGLRLRASSTALRKLLPENLFVEIKADIFAWHR